MCFVHALDQAIVRNYTPFALHHLEIVPPVVLIIPSLRLAILFVSLSNSTPVLFGTISAPHVPLTSFTWVR